jgi:hypothetical protein
MKSAFRKSIAFSLVLALAGAFAARFAVAEDQSSPTSTSSSTSSSSSPAPEAQTAAATTAAKSTAPADLAAEAKRADIRRLLELTGATKLGMQMMNQSLTSMRRAMPNVPKEFWEEFQASIDPNDLTELAVPAYEKHLTHADIKELIKFYESPIGKKMITVQPLIVADTMAAGQKWGRAMGMKVAKQLQEKGYDRKPGDPAPAEKP